MALQCVDAVSAVIESLFESDNVKNAFRDDANQYKSGPTKVITTASVAGLYLPKFKSKVRNTSDKRRG